MNVLNPLSFDEAQSETQEIFTALKSKIGMVPNLYAAMGVSSKLLGGYLAFVETLKSGEFSAKEYEAIALVTSEANNCEYCISAHTALGKMQGFTEEETIDIRQNNSANVKLNTLVNLTNELIKTKGNPTDEKSKAFLLAGYSKAAFAELIAIVSLTTITNTIHHNGNFAIDFPIAQTLNTKQVA